MQFERSPLQWTMKRGGRDSKCILYMNHLRTLNRASAPAGLVSSPLPVQHFRGQRPRMLILGQHFDQWGPEGDFSACEVLRAWATDCNCCCTSTSCPNEVVPWLAVFLMHSTRDCQWWTVRAIRECSHRPIPLGSPLCINQGHPYPLHGNICFLSYTSNWLSLTQTWKQITKSRFLYS